MNSVTNQQYFKLCIAVQLVEITYQCKLFKIKVKEVKWKITKTGCSIQYIKALT